MYIRINDKKYPCMGYEPEPEIRSLFYGVEGLGLPITGTIKLCTDDGLVLAEQNCRDYARQMLDNNVLTLTNEPEPPAPTIDDLRTAAYNRIKGKCSEAIMSGVTVNGKHYTLTEFDQLSINAAWNKANSRETEISFAADGEALSLYPAAQIITIGKAAYDWGVANRIYNSLLYKWIKHEEDADVLAGIKYGTALPNDLMAYLSQQLSDAGIDLSTLAGLLIT